MRYPSLYDIYCGMKDVTHIFFPWKFLSCDTMSAIYVFCPWKYLPHSTKENVNKAVKSVVIKSTCFMVETYSKLEVSCRKYIEPFHTSYIFSIYQSMKDWFSNNAKYEVIDNNGDIIFSTNTLGPILKLNRDSYNFILLNEKSGKRKLSCMVSDVKQLLGMNLIECDDYFITVEIKLMKGGETLIHTIDMKEPIIYYVESANVLSEPFMKYYMKSRYNILLNHYDSYEVALIDKEVNITAITSKQCIVFEKNNYVVKTF